MQKKEADTRSVRRATGNTRHVVLVVGGIGGVKRYHSLHRVVEAYARSVGRPLPSLSDLLAGTPRYATGRGSTIEFHQLYWADAAATRTADASMSSAAWLRRLPARVEAIYNRQAGLLEDDPPRPLPLTHLERTAGDLRAAIRLLSVALLQFRDDREELIEAVRGFFATYETHVSFEETPTVAPDVTVFEGATRTSYRSDSPPSAGTLRNGRAAGIQQRIFDDCLRLVAEIPPDEHVQVHLIAHSLGSVMALRLCLDLQQLQPAVFERIRSVHLYGSPLELFTLCHPQVLSIDSLEPLRGSGRGLRREPSAHCIDLHNYVELSDPVASTIPYTIKLLEQVCPGAFRLRSEVRYASKQLPVFSHTSYWTEEHRMNAAFDAIRRGARDDTSESNDAHDGILAPVVYWWRGTYRLALDLFLANRLQVFVILMVSALSVACTGVGVLVLAKARVFSNMSSVSWEAVLVLVACFAITTLGFLAAFLASGCVRYWGNEIARWYGLLSGSIAGGACIAVALLFAQRVPVDGIPETALWQLVYGADKALCVLFAASPLTVIGVALLSNYRRGGVLVVLASIITWLAVVGLVELPAAFSTNQQVDVGSTALLVAFGLGCGAAGVLLSRFLFIWVAFIRGREHIEVLALHLKVKADAGRPAHRSL